MVLISSSPPPPPPLEISGRGCSSKSRRIDLQWRNSLESSLDLRSRSGCVLLHGNRPFRGDRGLPVFVAVSLSHIHIRFSFFWSSALISVKCLCSRLTYPVFPSLAHCLKLHSARFFLHKTIQNSFCSFPDECVFYIFEL